MTDVAVIERPKLSLVARVAERFGVEPGKMLDTLKATAFKTDKPITNEQMMALLVVAENYHLNPFTRELFAFPDKQGGIVPVVSVDGWARIVNEHPAFDGMGFAFGADDGAMTCTMWRKDRAHPTVITEYLDECKRNTQPWGSHPRRMLRHKAMIQCARMAFGFAGLYDEDEAQRIVNMGPVDEVPTARAAPQQLRQALAQPPAPDVIVSPGPYRAVPTTPAPIISTQAAAPDAYPPAKPLAAYIDEVLHATDAETGALVIDEARSTLAPEQQAELVKVYQARFYPSKD